MKASIIVYSRSGGEALYHCLLPLIRLVDKDDFEILVSHQMLDSQVEKLKASISKCPAEKLRFFKTRHPMFRAFWQAVAQCKSSKLIFLRGNTLMPVGSVYSHYESISSETFTIGPLFGLGSFWQYNLSEFGESFRSNLKALCYFIKEKDFRESIDFSTDPQQYLIHANFSCYIRTLEKTGILGLLAGAQRKKLATLFDSGDAKALLQGKAYGFYLLDDVY